jgi:hypothetical protein
VFSPLSEGIDNHFRVPTGTQPNEFFLNICHHLLALNNDANGTNICILESTEA